MHVHSILRRLIIVKYYILVFIFLKLAEKLFNGNNEYTIINKERLRAASRLSLF